jgi:hypothetical protein
LKNILGRVAGDGLSENVTFEQILKEVRDLATQSLGGGQARQKTEG